MGIVEPTLALTTTYKQTVEDNGLVTTFKFFL